MTEITTSAFDLSLLRTKLHPPTLPSDYVARPQLVAHLSDGKYRPLILVSAPAGYGKSTLVAHWIDQQEWPYCWLTLSRAESDTRLFLEYVVATIQQVFPGSLQNTQELLKGGDLPGPKTLLNSIANEIDQLESPFILVLDDFQNIEDSSAVNDILSGLLEFPPVPLHVVIATRQDPVFDLERLRVRGQVSELRQQDLRFVLSETKELVQKSTDQEISHAALLNIDREFEGWPVGLKLATRNLRSTPNPDKVLSSLNGGWKHLTSSLFKEMLVGLTPNQQKCVLFLAQFDRFSASLCQTVCAPETASAQFLDQLFELLQSHNMFMISLDEKGGWFRFHHLFQEYLQSEIVETIEDGQICDMNLRASAWFKTHDCIEEAIVHALKAGEPDVAADIVASQRQPQINTDNWHVMTRWLKLLPEASKKRPEFLLAKAWVVLFRFHISELAGIVFELQAQDNGGSMTPAQQAELRFFEGELLFWDGKGEEAHAKFSLARTNLSANTQLAVLENVDAVSLLIKGHAKAAYNQIEVAESRADRGQLKYHYRVFHAHCVISFLAGDLERARREVEVVESYFDSQKMRYGRTWSGYILASVELQGGNFEAAVTLYRRIVKDKFLMHWRLAFDALAGHALALQLSGKPKAAMQAVAELKDFSRELLDRKGMEIAASCEARVLLLQGKVGLAAAWAGFSIEPGTFQDYFLWQEIPNITRVRIWLAFGSAESLKRVIEYSDQELARINDWHLGGQRLELLVIKSLALSKKGRSQDALECLDEAVRQASAGKWFRPFLEHGAPMADLLSNLVQGDLCSDSAVQILSHLRAYLDNKERDENSSREEPKTVGMTSTDKLTKRELEILKLLSDRYQNKEIALHLSVSPETIKSHLKHLFSKLGVSNRRDAAACYLALTS